MLWRILLASAIGGAVAIAQLLPVTAFSRFVATGLLFAVLSRAVFALALHLRVTTKTLIPDPETSSAGAASRTRSALTETATSSDAKRRTRSAGDS